MARTYNGSPVLSKIKLPGSQNPYYLKDADARAILDAINDGVYESLKLALGTVDAGGNNLVTAGNIKDYVDRIAEIGFDVVVLETLPTADETAYTTYHNNIVLIADASSKTGAYVEYVILRQGTVGAYTYLWEKIGTTEIDLSGYVKGVAYVDNTHTLTQTKNENGVDVTTDVHQFGNLADANTASTTYTPAGTITVNPLTQTATTATIDYDDYTPAGTISNVEVIDTVGTQASKAKDTFTAGSLPTKAADTFSAGTLPSKEEDTFTQGALPSFTEGAFNAGTTPSLTAQKTDTFAQAGITAAMDATDTEMLVFTTAATASAVTDRGTFNPGTLPSKAADTFNAGALPTFEEGAFDAGTLPSYTEGAFTQGTLPTFEEGAFTPNALPTKKTVTPTFTGTEAENVIAKTVTYDKATSAGATFTGTQATITVNPDSRNQTV